LTLVRSIEPDDKSKQTLTLTPYLRAFLNLRLRVAATFNFNPGQQNYHQTLVWIKELGQSG